MGSVIGLVFDTGEETIGVDDTEEGLGMGRGVAGAGVAVDVVEVEG